LSNQKRNARGTYKLLQKKVYKLTWHACGILLTKNVRHVGFHIHTKSKWKVPWTAGDELGIDGYRQEGRDPGKGRRTGSPVVGLGTPAKSEIQQTHVSVRGFLARDPVGNPRTPMWVWLVRPKTQIRPEIRPSRT
jgi:hypothetical protein